MSHSAHTHLARVCPSHDEVRVVAVELDGENRGLTRENELGGGEGEGGEGVCGLGGGERGAKGKESRAVRMDECDGVRM